MDELLDLGPLNTELCTCGGNVHHLLWLRFLVVFVLVSEQVTRLSLLLVQVTCFFTIFGGGLGLVQFWWQRSPQTQLF